MINKFLLLTLALLVVRVPMTQANPASTNSQNASAVANNQGVYLESYYDTYHDHINYYTTNFISGTSDHYFTMSWGNGGGGINTVHWIDTGSASPWWSPDFYEEYETNIWPATTWPQPLPTTADNIPLTFDSGGNYIASHNADMGLQSCAAKLQMSYFNDRELFSDETFDECGQATLTLATGGQPGSTRLNLWMISASATARSFAPSGELDDPPVGSAAGSIPYTQISVGVFGTLDSNGNAFKALPDNATVDVTPCVESKAYYTFNVDQQKYVPFISANTLRLDPDKVLLTNCVGEKIVFKLAFDPDLPSGILITNQNQWWLPPKYMNAYKWFAGDPSSGLGNYYVTTCDPAVTTLDSGGYDLYPPYCTNYLQVDWPLHQPETGAWWISGGDKIVSCYPTLVFTNGNTVSLTVRGRFDSYRPTAQMMLFSAQEAYRQFFTTSYGLTCKLKYGTDDGNNYGRMQYRVKVTSDYDGDAGITQICDLEYSNPAFQCTGNLDGSTVFYHETQPVWRSTNTNTNANNVPFFDGPESIWVSANRLKGSFQDFVRFRPTGNANIWVTLGIVTWDMHAVAERVEFSGVWELTTDSHPAPVGPDSSDTFPEWTKVHPE